MALLVGHLLRIIKFFERYHEAPHYLNFVEGKLCHLRLLDWQSRRHVVEPDVQVLDGPITLAALVRLAG
jgi:hypothetical protein